MFWEKKFQKKFAARSFGRSVYISRFIGSEKTTKSEKKIPLGFDVAEYLNVKTKCEISSNVAFLKNPNIKIFG